jgi:protein-tyrosine-phosphatase
LNPIIASEMTVDTLLESLDTPPPEKPLRVLFLCTGNSARSQIAEALLTRKPRGRFAAASAGSHPAARVNPLTVGILKELGIDWSARAPKGIDGVIGEPWDLIITVCDKAKEACADGAPVSPSP